MERLLCLVSSMNTGGAETFLMKLYRGLDHSLYQMDFCVNSTEKGFYDDEIRQMGGRLFYVPPKRNGIKTFKIELKKVISENHYSNVMRVTSNALGFLDLKIAKDAGAAKCIARSSNSNDAEGLKAKIAHFLGKVLYSKYVDVRIAPSDLAAIYTFGRKAYYNGEVNILRNGLDLNMYSFNEDSRKSMRESLGINGNDVLVGHIGRFTVQKNHKFLLSVFSHFHSDFPNSRLLLVGEGELKKEIEDECRKIGIDDAVIFAGVRSDIPQLLAAMDVFLFPSLYEGMPNSVIEAQVSGLPCVISDTITREADITSCVSFLPITGSVELWSNRLKEVAHTTRTIKTDVIKQRGYDIHDVLSDFMELCFH